ncbi:MAG: bifunctional phosphopantothenoylcysteine decarboxylase/phosphopantothenate--cysteine ligase CoaBC [Pseudomonadota bacterium]
MTSIVESKAQWHSPLAGKRIVLGVCGGIAAYKCLTLVRELKRANAEVRVVMTTGAQAFIQPLSFQALSGEPVHHELLDPEAESAMSHIALARWADLIVIAPTSAHMLAKLRVGLADDLLSTLCLATTAPIAVVPAMNQQMWNHAATQENLKIVQQRGIAVWGPASGSQACGEIGPGRMLEAEDILRAVQAHFVPKILQGKKFLITAGATQEPIDDVRFISNHSSGKMGVALAYAAWEMGAVVTLISGVRIDSVHPEIHQISIQTAVQMYEQVTQQLNNRLDCMIATAAVADVRPLENNSGKLPKSELGAHISITENPDIVRAVCQHTNRPKMVVAFAAEMHNMQQRAAEKLKKKGADWIVANDVSQPDRGFNADNNAVSMLAKNNSEWIEFEWMPKLVLARQLLAFWMKEL